MEDFNSKYSGEQVEALLDIVAGGISGGGGEGEVQKTTEAEIAAMGFTKNEGTITEVKMNGESKGSNGIVDLGTVITEHQNIAGIEGEVTANKLAQILSTPSEDNTNPLATAQDLESKTDIIASQIFLELRANTDDFQIFSHKRGYEEHNRKVCQRLIENCFTDKKPNNEVFFVTINGLRDGVPYMETAILESQAGEVVRASFVKGNINPTNLIAASIDILAIDAGDLRSYAESGEDLFYWKSVSTLVPSIDAIGSEGESDIYVTEFVFEQITYNGRAVNVSPELVSAIYNKRIIVIPSSKGQSYIATNVFSGAPLKNVSIQMQIVSGTFIYDVTLTANGTAPQTVPTRVSVKRLLSGTLNTINGASIASGVDMPLVSSISLNGKTYTPSKGAVDLGNINGTLIKEYMNVKPTVRIFHSTDPNKSSIYAYHPYLNEFGDGELVVMRYGKTKMAKWVLDGDERPRKHVTKTGWRECLGAPINLKDYVDEQWKDARFTEPAKLYMGQNYYMTVLEDICARATYGKIILVSDSGGEYEGLASMAQLMERHETTAIDVLQAIFYDQWEDYNLGYAEAPPDYSIFGGNRDRITLGVALRVLNPEFQKLLDEGILNTITFDKRRWYYDVDNDITIPKYFYSDVCEMYLSKGSMREMITLNLPRMPRLSLKG